MSSFFLVSQNQSHKYEFQHKLLWSPKLNQKYGKNRGYANMSHVKKGDIIFHVYNQIIHAVSVAKYDVYSSPRPLEYDGNIWNDDGWRVDCDMHRLEIPLSDHREWLNAHKGEVFDKNGKLKQQYLFKLNEEQKIYFSHLLSKELMQSLLLSDTTLTTKIPSLEEIKRNSTKRTKTNVNHTWVHSAQNDQLKDDIGKIGEQAVFKYLTEKYTESDYEIIPISSNLAGKKGNDAAGYDILLKNDKMITYIDVKTTTGSNQSFYMSAKEKSVLDSSVNEKNKIYNIYRVYGISKTGNDTAKFEIFKENSLKNANYQALDFFVSV
ncbi:protein NO VEIN domain-containing protein [Liquorilactobacillus hordei]|uniref:protein NO VEIN domain-containing protein n=1 Tax=Liquorilactobacillus hordei TaxID=468911 RepID=UPI0015E809E2